MGHEIAFEMATPAIRFGAGVTEEVGMDLVDLGVKRAMVVTDPFVAPSFLTLVESSTLAALGSAACS